MISISSDIDMNSFPLLIGGCPRSGTTALLQVLNSNPSIYISSEENLLNLVQSFAKQLGTRERRSKSLDNGMRALSIRETLSMDNIHSHNFTGTSLWTVIRYIYKWHHEQLHEESSLLVWGDKYPNYFKELDALLRLPKVRYLHITRNPLDVINSMLRRTEMAKQGCDWWRAITDFETMLETWASAYRAVVAVEKQKNVLHLHYEELVFDFENTISRINCFIDANLKYSNMLVSEPTKHFDRTFLDEKLTNCILAHPVVIEYNKTFDTKKYL